MVAAVNSMFS